MAGRDLKLQSTTDDFSYQVSAENDDRFWFRLERHADRDVVTDYCLGSVENDRAASVLLNCYQHLGLVPRKVIVFSDILASKSSVRDLAITAGSFLLRVQRLYGACGRAALQSSGCSEVEESLERTRGKYDLILRSVDPASCSMMMPTKRHKVEP
ncbi:MAG TPA: hypothetical protein VHC22_30720 [Pirellulales bacterium]|nr:hypothetical protein [Pirellulales bacterium]